MLLSDVANILQDKLNESELTFKVTSNEQVWFGYNVKSADLLDYIPVVVRSLPIPIITEFYRTRALEYAVELKGKIGDNETVEALIGSLREFKADGNNWYLSNFVVTDTGLGRDGRNLSREFRASFRITIYVPMFLLGNEVTVEVDEVPVDIMRVTGVFDKALVPNREYGDNESDISTGEEFIITIPLSDNAKVLDLFGNLVSKKYNKEYEIKFNFIVAEKTMSLVLSGGNFNIGADNNIVSFNAIFTRALERVAIKINSTTVNVIGFTPAMAIIPSPLNKGGETRVRRESYTTTYTMQLENDKSSLINDIVKEIDTHTNKKFTITWEFNGLIFSKDCILQSGNVPSSENPNAIITAIFVGGSFYGS